MNGHVQSSAMRAPGGSADQARDIYDRLAFNHLMMSPGDQLRSFFQTTRSLVARFWPEPPPRAARAPGANTSPIPRLSDHLLVRTVKSRKRAGWRIDRERSASRFTPEAMIVLTRGNDIVWVGLDGVTR